MVDLISSPVGGRIVDYNDEFFAPASNLISPGDPISNSKYTDRGKWMDGWETRRRREPGHDWCVIALGVPGRIERVTVDTSFFTGNYPESFSLEGCGDDDDTHLADADWEEILPQTLLSGDSLASFVAGNPHRFTHVRLNIFPDGGVARLRVEGAPIPSQAQLCPGEEPIDLLSMLVGGEAMDASDLHYSPPSNLLRPTEPAGMWDGWETKRRRGPGNDWVEFRLGLPGTIEGVVIDTRHFKGNAPGWVSILVSEDGTWWAPVLDRVPVDADDVALLDLAAPTHAGYLRVDIHPDGGLARVRALGRPDRRAVVERRVGYLNSLTGSASGRFFQTACVSSSWVESMSAGRPFEDLEGVLAAAATAFDLMVETDWLEAFAGHPRIGEEGDDTANREQAGVVGAEAETLAALTEANRRYEERFGFTYIVYASDKTAEEMLALAESRLASTREQELAVAADEQRAITATRLRTMLCEGEQR
ncbi:MAG TPA: allantoicase [Acidimicrobiia bacterium]|nr:allantoicase [Acidimicrobiia bacterium]